MLKSSLCDYSHADILFKGAITAINTAARGQPIYILIYIYIYILI